MKKLSIAFIALFATCLIASCNGDSTTETSTVSSDTADNSMTDTVSATPPDKEATDFVMKAASGGMMEVELGKIAQEQAKSQRVKDFGSMMVTDHSKANDELKSIASSKNISLSDSLMPEHKKHVDMLKNKSGAAFDKAYVDMMVKDHQKDIGEFKKASEGSTDADIKGFAGKTLPVLQIHLDSIQAIKKSKM